MCKYIKQVKLFTVSIKITQMQPSPKLQFISVHGLTRVIVDIIELQYMKAPVSKLESITVHSKYWSQRNTMKYN